MILPFALWLAVATGPVAVPAGYEPAARVIPPAHWALVTRIDLVARPGHGANYADGHVEVPFRPAPHILVHEVGHAVARAAPELEAEHTRLFVRPGQDAHEAFAEGYRGTLTGTPALEPSESAWYRSRVLAYLPHPRQELAAPEVIAISAPAGPTPGLSCGSIVSGAIVSGCALVPEGSIR